MPNVELFLACIRLQKVYAARAEQHLSIQIRIFKYFFENKMSPALIMPYNKCNIGPALYMIEI